MWRAYHGDVDSTWTELQHCTADVVDIVQARMWQAAGCPTDEPPHVVRPSDALANAQAKTNAAKVRQKITQGNWEEARDG